MTNTTSPIRCYGDDDALLMAHHDREWGRPLTGERELYESLCLEGFQAGISWVLILKKREALRRAFVGFDPEIVTRFGEGDVERLMGDSSIIRNRAKIEATIGNARAVLALREAGTSLSDIVWSYLPADQSVPQTLKDGSDVTPEAVALAKELKRLGFRFVGPTVAHAYMQTAGLLNPHMPECFVRGEVEAERQQVLSQARR